MTSLPWWSTVLKLIKKWDWKVSFFLAFFLSLYLTYTLYKQNEKIVDLNTTVKQIGLENEVFKKENSDLRFRLKILGIQTEEYSSLRKDAVDFARDWDISDFYQTNSDIFCPRSKGGNNYQRMTYEYDTPLTASNLNLKFKMINEDENILDYEQRMIVGVKINSLVFSEYDVPTRKGGVVNFRIADQNDNLIPGGGGGSISSPIKDGGIINLEFKTQPKHSQDIVSPNPK